MHLTLSMFVMCLQQTLSAHSHLNKAYSDYPAEDWVPSTYKYDIMLCEGIDTDLDILPHSKIDQAGMSPLDLPKVSGALYSIDYDEAGPNDVLKDNIEPLASSSSLPTTVVHNPYASHGHKKGTCESADGYVYEVNEHYNTLMNSFMFSCR